MIYISTDIETFGLDNKNSPIFEIGMVIDDTNNQKPQSELPSLRLFIETPTIPMGYALQMHEKSGLLKEYINSKDRVSKDTAWLSIANFIYKNIPEGNEIVFAGKNFGSFDYQFLKNQIPNFGSFDLLFSSRKIKINHRFIDIANCFVDWEKDNVIPDLKECKKRAGIDNTEVLHHSIQDAMDIVLLVRHIANKGK